VKPREDAIPCDFRHRAITPVAERILDKIELYAGEPQALAANVKRLKGDPGFRLRVGDWRVLFDEDAETVRVRGVRPRGSAYE
jgi:mRNA interferase RelE/StbE